MIARALLGLVFLVVVIGAAIFASAGTLALWRAWAYLAVFGGASLAITAYLIRYDRGLLERRVQAGPAAETSRTQRVLQSLASLAFLGTFVVAGLDARRGWSTVPAAASVAADAAVAVGFAIVFLVFRANTFTSATIEVAREQTVITTGPYRHVRHPMYAGAIVLLVATPIALGSWPALACAVALIGVVVARLRDEERFLAANLAGYAEYQERVRYRLVPGVW